VIVFGAGGHGRVVADAARSQGLEVVAFVDDAPKGAVEGLRVLAWKNLVEERSLREGVSIAHGIGDNVARSRAHERLLAMGFDIVTIVHARAIVATSVVLAVGAVVLAGAVVNSGARIGTGAVLNTACVVEHDCTIGDFAFVGPRAACGGTVAIGARAL